MNEETWITGSGRLKIADKAVDLELTVPANKVPLKKMLPVFQFLTDTVVKVGIENAAEQGEEITCTKGCGACCRQLVPISTIEANNLKELVANSPEPRRSELQRRFIDALSKIEAAGLSERLNTPESSTREWLTEIGMAYFELGIACPFLEDESCSIHPDRPLACREYLVTTPANNCQNPAPEKVTCIEIPISLSQALRTLSSKETTTNTQWLPLIQALAIKKSDSPVELEQSGQEWVSAIWAELTT